MVTRVLLKVAWMCAWPRGTDLRSRRRCRPTGRLGAFSAIRAVSLSRSAHAGDDARVCRRTQAADVMSRYLLLGRLLLAGDGLFGAALGAGVGAGALAVDGQVAAVAQATVAADLDQALDVHVHFAAQIALDLVFGVAVYVLAKTGDLIFGEVLDARVGADPSGGQN